MKIKILSALKIILPLGFGIFLIWLFYDALCEKEKKELFKAIGTANYTWVIIAVLFGFISHLSRAWRWRYLLQPLGYRVSFWNAYHAVMIGYIVNLIFPRAGEASRAGVLMKTDKVKFQQGFGTILAERAVDLGMLGVVALIALFLQMDQLEVFWTKINSFDETACGNKMVFSVLGNIVKYGIIAIVFGAFAAFVLSKKFRIKIREFLIGLWEGLTTVFKTKHKGQFVLHTLLIWVLYVAMFSVCFYALDSTSDLGLDAMMAGFIAGTIGIIVVQGGLGVYPPLVGITVTTYLDANAPGILPDALALGWIIWISQTLLIIILGLISLSVNSKNVTFGKNESLESNPE